jgi:hypothetical protein
MPLGKMRGAALAAAPADLTAERARECPWALAVLTRPSRHAQARPGPSRPAAARATGRRLPASSRASAAAPLAVWRFAVEPMRREIPARLCPERRKEGLLMRAQWT